MHIKHFIATIHYS